MILVASQLYFNGFQVNGILHDVLVIRDIVFGDWFPKWPDWLMFFQEFNDVLALQLKWNLFGFAKLLVIIPAPTSFKNSRNVQGIDPVLFLLSVDICANKGFGIFFQQFPIISHLVKRQLFNPLHDDFLLLFDDVTNSWVVNGWMYMTLHHCPSFIILDVSFPAFRWHTTVLTKALFPKVAQSQIISIGHHVLNFPFLHLFFTIKKEVHFNLFISLVPYPLTCSVEVMAKKAISANL